jgi:hypothetical protein
MASPRRPLVLRLAVVAMAVWLAAGPGVAPIVAQGATPDIAVVVHAGVQVDNLTLADLRRILTGDQEFWKSGERITIFIRAPVARERDAAVKDVCQMTEAQFRQHWIGKMFRADVPSGPKIVYSTDMALEQVSRTPGALALVEGTPTTKGVKVLKIDGKSPGQPGYRLR